MSAGQWKYIVDCWVTPGVKVADRYCDTFGEVVSHAAEWARRYPNGVISAIHNSCDEVWTGMLEDESAAVEAVVRAARARATEEAA